MPNRRPGAGRASASATSGDTKGIVCASAQVHDVVSLDERGDRADHVAPLNVIGTPIRSFRG